MEVHPQLHQFHDAGEAPGRGATWGPYPRGCRVDSKRWFNMPNDLVGSPKRGIGPVAVAQPVAARPWAEQPTFERLSPSATHDPEIFAVQTAPTVSVPIKVLVSERGSQYRRRQLSLWAAPPRRPGRFRYARSHQRSKVRRSILRIDLEPDPVATTWLSRLS
jgi:hypothetical protein